MIYMRLQETGGRNTELTDAGSKNMKQKGVSGTGGGQESRGQNRFLLSAVYVRYCCCWVTD